MNDQPPKASLLQVVFTVLSGMFGIRRQQDHDKIAQKINPLHLLAVAVVVLLIFIVSLIFIVKSIVP